MEHSFFGIIPARAGSKGIINKNMQLIGDKPMIMHTFEAALNSNLISKFIVTTDDETVIQLANRHGIAVPFVRPKELARDNSSSIDVIKHALAWYKIEYSKYPENIVLLQPTSPFRTNMDIDSAIDQYINSNKKSLISVCEVSQHPNECIILDDSGQLAFIDVGKKDEGSGRQSFKKAYFMDGSIYIASVERFLDSGVLYDRDSDVFVIAKSHALDIDDWHELNLARAMYCYNKEIDDQAF